MVTFLTSSERSVKPGTAAEPRDATGNQLWTCSQARLRSNGAERVLCSHGMIVFAQA
jgi:hypothetical protein